jgi:hypothetical protein
MAAGRRSCGCGGAVYYPSELEEDELKTGTIDWVWVSVRRGQRKTKCIERVHAKNNYAPLDLFFKPKRHRHQAQNVIRSTCRERRSQKRNL